MSFYESCSYDRKSKLISVARPVMAKERIDAIEHITAHLAG